jgi:hypothetical protein
MAVADGRLPDGGTYDFFALTTCSIGLNSGFARATVLLYACHALGIGVVRGFFIGVAGDVSTGRDSGLTVYDGVREIDMMTYNTEHKKTTVTQRFVSV